MGPSCEERIMQRSDHPPRAEEAIPALFGELYEALPAPDRCRLVEALIRPLGVLSLMAVAHGIFAGIRLRNGPREVRVSPAQLGRVTCSDVIALVAHAQQVSVETVDGLAPWIGATPHPSAAAAADLLVDLLAERSRRRERRDAVWSGARASGPWRSEAAPPHAQT
jgi:hypothetical protein